MNAADTPVRVNLQVVSEEAASVPEPAAFFRDWVNAAAAAAGARAAGVVTVRLVDAEESANLNRRYRAKDGPTNVLAFPAGPVPDEVVSEREMGDLVICLPRARQEAVEQHKALGAHLAHLTVHGILHLIGYDHETGEDALEMEELERNILAERGIADPYAEVHADTEAMITKDDGLPGQEKHHD